MLAFLLKVIQQTRQTSGDISSSTTQPNDSHPLEVARWVINEGFHRSLPDILE